MANYITKGVGTLRFDPQVKSTSRGRWWLILECGEGWWNLYSYWSDQLGWGRWVHDRHGKLQWANNQLVRPAWGPHVSVIRREKPRKNLNRWGAQEGRRVEFWVDPFVHFNQEYWWLNARCPELLDIREFYGLRREPKMRLHLTVGRVSP